jgi:hypothetical protein
MKMVKQGHEAEDIIQLRNEKVEIKAEVKSLN